MRIASANRNTHIDLEWIGSELVYYPSISFSFTIHISDFADYHYDADVSLSDLEQFVADLTQMDSTRTGKASIRSTCPYELTLEFEVYNRARHIKLDFSAKKYLSSDFAYEQSVRGAFEIDASEFAEIVRGFRELQTAR